MRLVTRRTINYYSPLPGAPETGVARFQGVYTTRVTLSQAVGACMWGSVPHQSIRLYGAERSHNYGTQQSNNSESTAKGGEYNA